MRRIMTMLAMASVAQMFEVGSAGYKNGMNQAKQDMGSNPMYIPSRSKRIKLKQQRLRKLK